MKLENPEFVDQKFQQVAEFIASRPEIFTVQGQVIQTWRTYKNRRLGPYYQLIYREGSRQRALYLGRSGALAERVRELLGKMQAPKKDRRSRTKTRALIAAEMRRTKHELNQQLGQRGLYLKGFEIRGWRTARVQADRNNHKSN